MGSAGTKCWLKIVTGINFVAIFDNYNLSKLAQLCTVDENKGWWKETLHSSVTFHKGSRVMESLGQKI